MDRRLAEKLIADRHFITFCNLVSLLRAHGYGAGIPLDTALMLYDTEVSLVKGEEDFTVIHKAVAEFLEPGMVPETADFYDYIVSVLGSH